MQRLLHLLALLACILLLAAPAASLLGPLRVAATEESEASSEGEGEPGLDAAPPHRAGARARHRLARSQAAAAERPCPRHARSGAAARLAGLTPSSPRPLRC